MKMMIGSRRRKSSKKAVTLEAIAEWADDEVGRDLQDIARWNGLQALLNFSTVAPLAWSVTLIKEMRGQHVVLFSLSPPPQLMVGEAYPDMYAVLWRIVGVVDHLACAGRVLGFALCPSVVAAADWARRTLESPSGRAAAYPQMFTAEAHLALLRIAAGGRP